MSVKGIGGRRTLKQSVEMMKFMSGTLKPKKKRKAPVRKSATNDMVEKGIEEDIIYWLRSDGYDAYKCGETSTYNARYIQSGKTDIEIFGSFGVIYMEVKQPSERRKRNGGLRKSQVKFRDMCRKYKLNHCVVYSREEARNEINKYARKS